MIDCFKFDEPELNYEGYIGFSASNFQGFVSDIDLNKVKVQNTKHGYYDDEKGSREMYIDLRKQQRENLQKQARDVLHDGASKVQEQQKHQASTIQLGYNDDLEAVLVKFYETQRHINLQLKDQVTMLKNYK